MDISKIPDFDDLPSVDGMPKGCAWGIFDKEGKKDLLGTLNLLTPEVVKAAASEVRDGVSISLNWPINAMAKIPIPGRKKPIHTIASLKELGLAANAHGWDDEIDMNTQCSSQWDSLVHWQHQPSALAYNGTKPTKEELSKDTTADNSMPTLDHWHARGGVVGRGVLIDYKAYAEAKGLNYSPVGVTRITIQDIEDVAKHQGLEFRPGDIFLIRTGFTEVIENFSVETLMGMAQGLVGIHGAEETAKWFWNKHFAAVASDTPAFEAYPPLKEDGSPGDQDGLVLHPYFLSLFGMSIGEYWDLRRLAEYCKKTGRYTFMLTSSPLNMPCLVGSPPNALAIF